MPKKRSYNFKALQGASASPPHNSHKDVGASSVNARLQELRRLESREAAARKREIAELVNQKSVPPHLRGILGVPESAPPKPKAGARARGGVRHRLAGSTRQPPGPAPPKSWLRRSNFVWAPSLTLPSGRSLTRRFKYGQADHERPATLLRFARLTGRESGNPEERRPPSLLHLALRTAAQCWELFDDDDLSALSELPIQLRVRLLSYLGYYGPPVGGVTLDALTCGADGVTLLDLGGLVGHNTLSLPRVAKSIKADTSSRTLAIDHIADSVSDSWEHADELMTHVASRIVKPQFNMLTHLCLSDPPQNILWRDLLSFSKLLPGVTHLSLARWPRPTLTPNLTTATVVGLQGPEVAAGGSHYYSELDDDMYEPFCVLRRLSANLLCLQWLDLEGCASWAPALAVQAVPPVVGHVETNADVPPTVDPWRQSGAASLIFLETWENVSYLNVSQGWVPSLTSLSGFSEKDLVEGQRSIYKDLLKTQTDPGIAMGYSGDTDPFEIEKKRAKIWLQCESKTRAACSLINWGRRERNVRPLTVDFGWMQKPA